MRGNNGKIFHGLFETEGININILNSFKPSHTYESAKSKSILDYIMVMDKKDNHKKRNYQFDIKSSYFSTYCHSILSCVIKANKIIQQGNLPLRYKKLNEPEITEFVNDQLELVDCISLCNHVDLNSSFETWYTNVYLMESTLVELSSFPSLNSDACWWSNELSKMFHLKKKLQNKLRKINNNSSSRESIKNKLMEVKYDIWKTISNNKHMYYKNLRQEFEALILNMSIKFLA